MSKICLLVTALLLLGCGNTPETIHEDEQFAIVQYNSVGGNKIIIPNLDEVKYYNLFRFQEVDSTYVFLIKLRRPTIPKRGNLGPYAIEWVDYKFHSKVPYRIDGLKDNGENWFTVEIRYMDLKK